MLDEGMEVAILLDTYEKLLTETQAKILRMRFDEDLSLGEIGEILNISRQAVRNTILKGEEKLRFYEENFKIISKEKEINRIADLLSEDPLTKQYSEMLKKVTEEM